MKKFMMSLPGMHVGVELSRESPAQAIARTEQEFRRHNIYFEGEFPSWSAAAQLATGYGASAILRKLVDATREVVAGRAAYERDTVLFGQAQVSHPLFSWLLYAARELDEPLKVMDFGGALGSAYHQHRRFLESELRWGVVEQQKIVDAGRAEFATPSLDFFASASECMESFGANFLLLSASLQYMQDPYGLLDQLLAFNFPYCLVDRTTSHRLGRDRVFVQHVPEWIYSASYPIWLLDADRLEQCFDRHGYEVIDLFEPYPGSFAGNREFQAPYMGWFLQKKRMVRVQ
ncbi:methyltransferase, TIGR04325 family [Polaromonas sp.]|uniref:methyltransferase, TIGR04325 family n=1 Tax=Polaromonas sp. TaxID=1869339 RepID=UPI003266CB9C